MTKLPDYFALVPLFFLLLFIFMQWQEKRRFINGIVFNFFLFTGLIELALLVFKLNNQTLNYIAIAGLIVTFLILLFFYVFGFLLFLWNAYIVWKRESHTLSNMLTLFIGLGLLFLFFAPILANLLHIPASLRLFIGTIVSIHLFYLPVFFYIYLSSLIIYQFNHPQYQQDYIIVLGSGLINGETVPPLLASRINRAISFAQRQVAKGHPAPKLVFSGGQGPDEKLPEAVAMQNYALMQGIPIEQTLVETKSVNTLQNMQFSKQVIAVDSTQPQPKIIFATNNYHTFRASLFAKQAQLPADGIGAKTSKYFLPNATIREFIAILSMKKRQFMVVSFSSFIIAVITVFLRSGH